MSYQKYLTECLVLRGFDRGESDRLLSLFTKEFGLIRARASAVRSEKSKMRYSLQPYAQAQVSLVRGTRGWRAAGASHIASFDPTQESGIRVFARVSVLIERLIIGEERSDYLYGTLLEAHEALRRAPVEAHPSIELLSVARTLFALGYLSPEALKTGLFEHTGFSDVDVASVTDVRDALLLSVNAALSETQL